MNKLSKILIGVVAVLVILSVFLAVSLYSAKKDISIKSDEIIVLKSNKEDLENKLEKQEALTEFSKVAADVFADKLGRLETILLELDEVSKTTIVWFMDNAYFYDGKEYEASRRLENYADRREEVSSVYTAILEEMGEMVSEVGRVD